MSVSTSPRARLAGLDRWRGLAVVCMVVDHLVLVVSGPEVLRLTVGRLALPVFFILAGVLARRCSWRTLMVGLVGLVLPLVVPWIDSPNVLVLYALGVPLVVLTRRSPPRAGFLAVVLLTWLANGFGGQPSGFYHPAALWLLMLLGAFVSRVDVQGWGLRLPSWFESVGRFPLTVYVGHLVLLQACLVAS